MPNIRKLPPYEELSVEYDNIRDDLNLKKIEAIRYIANKYNCHVRTVCKNLRISQQRENDTMTEPWTKEYADEWNKITKKILSIKKNEKYILIVKYPKYKNISATDIPKGFIY